MKQKLTEPLVSVCMITYNHGKFISQAIDSVLMQKTNFNFEIVISDDYSTDNTREICLTYKGKYSDIINLTLQPINIGASKNYLQTISKCRGKYIALLEGDDYWTDSLKLQKQADYLEKNPDYGLVYMDSVEISEGIECDFKPPKGFKRYEGFVFYKLLKYHFLGTNSVCFRSDLLDLKLLEKINFILDTYVFLIIAMNTKFHFINEVGYVHRVHPGSISIGLKKNNLISKLHTLAKYEAIKIFLEKKKGISKYFNILFARYLYYFSFNCKYLSEEEKKDFRRHIVKNLF